MFFQSSSFDALTSFMVSSGKQASLLKTISNGLYSRRSAALMAAGFGYGDTNKSFSTAISQKRVQVDAYNSSLEKMELQSEALDSVSDKLDTLLSKAALATNPAEDQDALDEDAQALIEEIGDLITDTVDDDGNRVLSGETNIVRFGSEQDYYTDPNLQYVKNELDGLDLSTPAGAQAALGLISTARTVLTQQQVTLTGKTQEFTLSATRASNEYTSLVEAKTSLENIQDFFATGVLDNVSLYQAPSAYSVLKLLQF